MSAGESIGIDVTVVSVDSAGYAGVLSENLMSGKNNDYFAIAHHLLVVGGTILGAKTSADGTAIGCSGIVTGVFDDCFYIESPDRTYGIRVQMPSSGLTLGQTANVAGTVGTLDSGERCINATQVTQTGTADMDPLCLTNKTLGGGDFGSVAGEKQPGVSSGVGLNNIGLYVKTTGQVGEKNATEGWFMIDDGSGVGVAVYGSIPDGNPYVTVTGVSSCVKSGSMVGRVVLATDVQTDD